MIRTVLMVAVVMATAVSLLYAQSGEHDTATKRYSIGLIGGAERLSNETTLPIVPGSDDCGTFSDGMSTGFWGGIMVDYPVLAPYLEASGRLLYSVRPASLQAQTQLSEVYDRANDRYVPMLVGHEYDASLGYLIVDLGVRIQPLPSLPVYLRLSVDAGNALFDASYNQRAGIDAPSFILFNDGTKEHTVAEGTIDDITTAYGAVAAIGGDIPFQGNLSLVPELAFRYGLNSVLSRSTWETQSVRAGLGLKWTVYDEPAAPPSPKEQPQPDNTPAEVPPVVIASLSSRPLEVQETVVTQTFPLLPYIFFDSARAELRTRYRPDIGDRTSFSERGLPKHALSTYYHLLHIIGKRLQERPKARVTITGATDGRELAEPEERRELAERRARAVGEFLMSVWNIAPDRLSYRTVDRPALASSGRYTEGNEENRRVELDAEDPLILEPVVHSKFLEYMPVQDKQQFSIEVLRPERAKGWDLTILHNNALMAVRNGDGAPVAVEEIQVAPETLTALGERIGDGTEQLTGLLQIVQDDGSVLEADCTFPVKKTRNEFEVSRLSLIVFDFDRSDISTQNREMMNRFISEAVRPTSDVYITGSTDRLGEALYNMELSRARAEAVQTHLMAIRPDTRIQSVEGIGASKLPYDNNVPEGRYYCRTVSLEVRTPLQR